MPFVVSHPVFETAALPFAATLAAALVLRVIAGRERIEVVGGLAVAVGFLAAYLEILGTPPLPARSSGQKIAYIATAGAVLGLALDIVAARSGSRRLAALVFAGVAVWWLLGHRARDLEMVLSAGLPLLTAWAIVLSRLQRVAGRGRTAGVMLVMAATGLAIVAWWGRTASAAQLAGALAAATGAFLLLSALFTRFRFAEAAVLGGGAALLAIAGQLALYTGASPWALAVLILVFFADHAARRIRLGNGARARGAAPVLLALVAAVPVAGAGVIAYLSAV